MSVATGMRIRALAPIRARGMAGTPIELRPGESERIPLDQALAVVASGSAIIDADSPDAGGGEKQLDLGDGRGPST